MQPVTCRNRSPIRTGSVPTSTSAFRFPVRSSLELVSEDGEGVELRLSARPTHVRCYSELRRKSSSRPVPFEGRRQRSKFEKSANTKTVSGIDLEKVQSVIEESPRSNVRDLV